MISFLRGKIIYIKEKEICLEVQGVGYRVFVPQRLLKELTLEQEVAFWVETLVREDAIDLYGFAEQPERELFKLLLKVSGVGPKAALNLLSDLDTAELARAIMQEDLKKLSGVSGVGKKTAERITLELKEKVFKALPETELKKTALNREASEVLEFLVSLKASPVEAEQVLKQALEVYPKGNFEELLGESLKMLRQGK